MAFFDGEYYEFNFFVMPLNSTADLNKTEWSDKFDSNNLTGGFEFSVGVKGVSFSLKYNDNTFYVVRAIYPSVSSTLVIPETYNGKPVKEFQSNAFAGTGLGYPPNIITSMVIPKTIVSVNVENILMDQSIHSFGNMFDYYSTEGSGNAVFDNGGTSEEWSSVRKDSGTILDNAIVKFYSETYVENGWHFVNGMPIAW